MGYFLKHQEPAGRFVGKTEYELLESLVFESDELGLITVPPGTVTDFASIPRAFWRILPPWDTHRRAGVVHDWLYTTQKHTRKEADQVFLEAMKALGVPLWKRQAMYAAVRMFGFVAWNNHKKENLEPVEYEK